MPPDPSPPPDPGVLVALRKVHLFASLPQAHLEAIARVTSRKSIARDEFVVRQNDPADTLYLILEGTFKVYLEQKSIGFEKVLATLQPGDHFGELALLAGEKRSASVIAQSEGKVLAIHRDDLQKLLAASPDISVALNTYLARFALRSLDQHAQIPLLNLDNFPEVMRYQRLLPDTIVEACKAFPLERQDRNLTVGMVNPHDADTRSFLKQCLRDYELQFVAVSAEHFQKYLQLRLRESGQSSPQAKDTPITELRIRTADGVNANLNEYDTSGVLERILRDGIELQASDIHLEPHHTDPRVRLRLNGNLIRRQHQFGHRNFNQIISNIKVLSNLDITERRLPQDGSFRIQADHRVVDARVSIIPCHGGEKVVLRLLDPDTQKNQLSDILLSEPVALLAREMFLQPDGLFLVTGPTGSGKTTTLYAGLHENWRDSESRNILTVEDPIDYHLPFATQVQVNNATGLNFSRILRSALRQDPDVILIGEIRDQESAAISLQAAVTGHLVLSTLHSNFVREAVTRLLHLVNEPDLLSSALKGVISQRLSGWLCQNCQEEVPRDDPSIAHLYKQGVLSQDEEPFPLRRSKGCELCAFTGHIGRVGVFEILAVEEEVRKMIADDQFANRFDSRTPTSAFVPMSRYARFLLRRGIVSPESIVRCFTHIVSMPDNI